MLHVTLSLHGAGEGHVAAEVVASAGQHEVEAVVAAVAHQDVLHRAARRLVRLQEGDAVLRGAAAASCGGGGGGGSGEDLVEEEERHGGGGEGEQPPGGRAGHHEPSLHSSPTTAAMLNASPCFTQLRCWQRCADLLPTFWLGEGQAGGCSDPDHGHASVCVGVCCLHTAQRTPTQVDKRACTLQPGQRALSGQGFYKISIVCVTEAWRPKSRKIFVNLNHKISMS